MTYRTKYIRFILVKKEVNFSEKEKEIQMNGWETFLMLFSIMALPCIVIFMILVSSEMKQFILKSIAN